MYFGCWHCATSSVRVVIGCRRIRQKDDAIVAKHSVPCCCVAAILCARPRYDDSIDTPLAQDHLKVSSKKAAVAMLRDDMLTGCRRQIRVNVHTRCAIDQRITI